MNPVELKIMREICWIRGQNIVNVRKMLISKASSHLFFPPNLLPLTSPLAIICHLPFILITGRRHRSSVTLGTMWLGEAALLLFPPEPWPCLSCADFEMCLSKNQRIVADSPVSLTGWMQWHQDAITFVHQTEAKFPLIFLLQSKQKTYFSNYQWQCLSSNSCLHFYNPLFSFSLDL